MDHEDRQVDAFDRAVGALTDLPDVIRTRPSVQRITLPLVGHSHTFITQTFKQRDVGDTIFLEVSSKEGHFRLVLPPKVADVIARQRDSLAHRSRSKAAKEKTERRMAEGFVPFRKKQAS